eukprot:1161827-Pelagomonas_calceolata.AAC.5
MAGGHQGSEPPSHVSASSCVVSGSERLDVCDLFPHLYHERGAGLQGCWATGEQMDAVASLDAGLEVYNAHLAPATTPAAAKAPGCVEALEAAHLAALEAGILAYRQKVGISKLVGKRGGKEGVDKSNCSLWTHAQAMGVAPQQAMESEAKLRAAMESRYQPLMVARVAEADMHAREMLSVRALRLAELLGKEPLDADALHVQLGHMLVDYNAQLGHMLVDYNAQVFCCLSQLLLVFGITAGPRAGGLQCPGTLLSVSSLLVFASSSCLEHLMRVPSALSTIRQYGKPKYVIHLTQILQIALAGMHHATDRSWVQKLDASAAHKMQKHEVKKRTAQNEKAVCVCKTQDALQEAQERQA